MELTTASFILALFHSLASAQSLGPCRLLPDDDEWPSAEKWQSLNTTVQGRLIKTVPLPHVCHSQPFGAFDQNACDDIKAKWLDDQTYLNNPAEVMNPYVQNQTCDPFTPTSKPCELGNYASYSILVTGPQDVIAGVKFCRENNIRLAIKNTGHDFAGKSSGKGALSLWTHHFNKTEIIEFYQSPEYNGPAVKLGSGAVGGIVYSIVGAAGYRIMGGTCPTVGLAGGYTSGGGHSLLNGLYGMAADAVLEWEVITAQGDHLTATPHNNADLYWALTGGGAGTFAVVLTMTTKIFPDSRIGSGKLRFNATETNYWEAIEDFWAYLPQFVDAGPNTWDFDISPTGFQDIAITVPDKSPMEVRQLLQPLFDDLDKRSIEYVYTPDEAPSYLEHFSKRFGRGISGAGAANIQLASRLIPREGVINRAQNRAIVNAMRAFVDNKYWSMGCHALNVKNIKHPDNSVLPKWRDAIATCNIVSTWDWDVPWSEMQARKQLLVDSLIPGLESVTPGSGSYLNEVEAQWKGDWKKELYADNYDRLLEIKNKYDPHHVFYARTAVGSDSWVIDRNGRLCRTS
ncbi:putative FAD-dependent isoamyl alcohol oxidase [Colletotrichum somersetense]|nr:putative FAD-dependent isoamyl alcohol oxidase [Colletotrichum somersetense]